MVPLALGNPRKGVWFWPRLVDCFANKLGRRERCLDMGARRARALLPSPPLAALHPFPRSGTSPTAGAQAGAQRERASLFCRPTPSCSPISAGLHKRPSTVEVDQLLVDIGNVLVVLAEHRSQYINRLGVHRSGVLIAGGLSLSRARDSGAPEGDTETPSHGASGRLDRHLGESGCAFSDLGVRLYWIRTRNKGCACLPPRQSLPMSQPGGDPTVAPFRPPRPPTAVHDCVSNSSASPRTMPAAPLLVETGNRRAKRILVAPSSTRSGATEMSQYWPRARICCRTVAGGAVCQGPGKPSTRGFGVGRRNLPSGANTSNSSHATQIDPRTLRSKPHPHRRPSNASQIRTLRNAP